LASPRHRPSQNRHVGHNPDDDFNKDLLHPWSPMTIDAHCRVHWRVWVDQPMVRAGPTLLRVVTYGRHENADGRHRAGKHRVEQKNVSVALAVVLDVPLVLIVLYILVVPYTDRTDTLATQCNQ
jgi:hypothetical protein